MKHKSMIILVVLTLALLVSAYSRAIQSGIVKKEAVTTQTLAGQPAGKPYVLDLTRKGIVYEVAAGIDYSRLRVRTAGGDLGVSDTVKKMGSISGKLYLGTLDDMRGQNFFFPSAGGSVPAAAAQQYTCSSSACECHGFSDCLRMTLDKMCKDYLLCTTISGKQLCLCPKK